MASWKGNNHGAVGIEAAFYEDSWTEDEYLAACQHPDLLNSVISKLDVPLGQEVVNPSVDVRIKAKHYYAGGSARFMFRFSTDVVKQLIDHGIRQVQDVANYLVESVADVNKLVNSYRNPGGTRYTSILCQYAELELAVRRGPRAVEAMQRALQVHGNKAMDGWMFELIFFSRLTTDRFRVKPKSGEVRLIPRANRPFAQDVPARAELFSGSADVWIKPSRFNQAGFDAVLISPGDKTVEFFQVTRSLAHKLPLKHFADCLSNLDRTLKFKVTVSIVVPMAHLDTFTLGKVTDSHLMTVFESNWSILSNVGIVGMEDVLN
jgi:hypothetical protein